MDKFLDLKEKQEREKICEAVEKEVREIKEKDKIVKIMKEAKDRIEELDEDFNLKYFPTFDYITKETKMELDKIHKWKDERWIEIYNKYDEIRALCEGANHSERMEIYKMYGLIEG